MTDQNTLSNLAGIVSDGKHKVKYLCCSKCRDPNTGMTLHWSNNYGMYLCDCSAKYESLSELDYI